MTIPPLFPTQTRLYPGYLLTTERVLTVNPSSADEAGLDSLLAFTEYRHGQVAASALLPVRCLLELADGAWSTVDRHDADTPDLVYGWLLGFEVEAGHTYRRLIAIKARSERRPEAGCTEYVHLPGGYDFAQPLPRDADGAVAGLVIRDDEWYALIDALRARFPEVTDAA